MKAIKVRLYGNSARIMGNSVVEFYHRGELTVRQVIEELVRRRPPLSQELFSEGNVNKRLIILVNGRHIMFIQGLETKVKGGDVIDIIPTVAGG